MARALDLHSRGQGFDSLILHQKETKRRRDGETKRRGDKEAEAKEEKKEKSSET